MHVLDRVALPLKQQVEFGGVAEFIMVTRGPGVVSGKEHLHPDLIGMLHPDC